MAGPASESNIDYLLCKCIGKGSFGAVYRALNHSTGNLIAVKQVIDQDDKIRGKAASDALRNESEILGSLSHPNIVQYLGFEGGDGSEMMFMEYVSNGSIRACLREHGRFEDQVCRSFTGQVLEGIGYCHSKGIIHRDLKSDNILVGPYGVCKIADFGTSKRTDDVYTNKMHSPLRGTLIYMAPEVLRATFGYSAKVDIWSLGCVVSEMWTGHRPWEGREVANIILVLGGKKPEPPCVPLDAVPGPDGDDFRRRCLSISPDGQPTASELRQHPYLAVKPGWSFTCFK
ncbi:BCK1_2 [Sanghuangporus sanghuang]